MLRENSKRGILFSSFLKKIIKNTRERNLVFFFFKKTKIAIAMEPMITFAVKHVTKLCQNIINDHGHSRQEFIMAWNMIKSNYF
jgi:hypothetical protein